MRNLIAASVIALAAMPAASFAAETVRVGCDYGKLTIARLAGGDCMDRIPLPTPRPQAAEVKQTSQASPAEPEDFKFIRSPNPKTGEMRTVRIVGPSYLPDDDEGISLRRQASVTGDALNTAFHSFASLFGVTSAQADDAKAASDNAIEPESDSSAMERLEAHADIRIHAAHN
jgi:hypothetical protein